MARSSLSSLIEGAIKRKEDVFGRRLNAEEMAQVAVLPVQRWVEEQEGVLHDATLDFFYSSKELNEEAFVDGWVTVVLNLLRNNAS